MLPAGNRRDRARVASVAMTSSPPLDLARIRCATFHEALQVDPVGSAAHSDAFLCVEVPLPWERDIGLHEPFASLDMGGGRHRWRPLGLVPAEASTDIRRVLAYLPAAADGSADGSPDGGFTSLTLREWAVAADHLSALCTVIVEDDPDAVSASDAAQVHYDG